MGRAAIHGTSCKAPLRYQQTLGDTGAYDIGIEHGQNFLRVQVKSASSRRGAGYSCRFEPHCHKKQDYTLEQIDLFAAYVIPVNVWYLIPAAMFLGTPRICNGMLFPVVPPKKKACYRYEGYREAWNLLRKSRSELAECGRSERRSGTRRGGRAAL